MRGAWDGGSNRGGNSGRGAGGSGSRGNTGPGSSGMGSNGAPAGRSNPNERWSNELDAIFERAPKETTAPKNDDERNFFEERIEVKPATLACPNCRETSDYALTWLVRRKREHPVGYADEATHTRFEKARSYMVRKDDSVACQNVRCRKRFEIVGVQTVAFLENAAKGSVQDRAARVRAAFTGRTRG